MKYPIGAASSPISSPPIASRAIGTLKLGSGMTVGLTTFAFADLACLLENIEPSLSKNAMGLTIEREREVDCRLVALLLDAFNMLNLSDEMHGKRKRGIQGHTISTLLQALEI